jgi:hypothetical protein
MKTLIIALFLFLTPSILVGQNLKALDDKYGFREAKFETPLSSFNNLKKVNEEPTGLISYNSTNENLNLGNYILDEIRYVFYKEQLAAVAIVTKGESNSRGVLKILQVAYGNGYQGNEYIEEYYWYGQKVIMSYDQDSITGDAIILIFSIKLSNIRKAENEKANSDAAKQL